MPDFGNAFSGLSSERKLSHEELIRAIRFMVAAEYEAVQLYMQLAESTDNKLAIAVLKDIADEERVHAGEFLRLLHELSPDEENFYKEGAEEVEEDIENKWIIPWCYDVYGKRYRENHKNASKRRLILNRPVI